MKPCRQLHIKAQLVFRKNSLLELLMYLSYKLLYVDFMYLGLDVRKIPEKEMCFQREKKTSTKQVLVVL